MRAFFLIHPHGDILPGERLADLYRDATALGLHTLIELHDADQLPRVLDTGAPVVGINNRDLRTFATRLEHTLELLPIIPADRTVVSESGIRTHADLVRLGEGGAKAVLVGESLMRAPDIGAALDAPCLFGHLHLPPVQPTLEFLERDLHSPAAMVMTENRPGRRRLGEIGHDQFDPLRPVVLPTF